MNNKLLERENVPVPYYIAGACYFGTFVGTALSTIAAERGSYVVAAFGGFASLLSAGVGVCLTKSGEVMDAEGHRKNLESQFETVNNR